MSEIRLVVREAERDWSGTLHGSCADRAIAALSADPLTLAELEHATERFARPTASGRYFGNLRPGLCTQPHDAGLVIIDLVARLVVAASTYSSPGAEGAIEYHDGQRCTKTRLPYHLAADWLFLSDGDQWMHVAQQRRQERAAKPVLDARAVFYGRPLMEFIARETFAAVARSEQIAPKPVTDEDRYASPYYDTLSRIHATWLLTPRDDLGGDPPRAIALDRHDHLMWDLQDRCQQWSLLDECPPGLAASSHAYRYGGFGTHELVKYYDLVRESLWSSWDQLTELAQSTTGGHRLQSLSVDDFLRTEIPRLESVREAWFDTPDPECHGRTPRSMIDRERARLPEAMSGHDAMIDPDCPCCQMLSDLPGPSFWHLDGSGMDDDFAFNLYCRTREEWEEERRSWEEHNRRFNAEWDERKRLGVTDANSSASDSGAIWSRSFCVGDTAEVPLGIRLFGLGCHLAELITDLRGDTERGSTPRQAQQSIEELNRAFGNLRELLQHSEPSLAEALLDPVLDRFAETLATVAAVHPDLAPKCESLTDSLRTLTDPSPPEPSWDPQDDDLPF
jgi:hypothetical protein